MATGINSTNVSPNKLRYVLDGTNGTPFTRTQAQLVAACAAGPLKAYLAGLTAAQFNNLDLDPAVTIKLVPSIGTLVASRVQFGGSIMTVTLSVTGVFAVVLELGFEHSLVR